MLGKAQGQVSRDTYVQDAIRSIGQDVQSWHYSYQAFLHSSLSGLDSCNFGIVASKCFGNLFFFSIGVSHGQTDPI